MPTYEYECNTCGHRFDQFQNISDAPVTECPECQGNVRRLISGGAGVIVKGGGAAETSPTTRCGREQTCCGREERCATPPCHS